MKNASKLWKFFFVLFLTTLSNSSFAAVTVLRKAYNLDGETIYYSDNTNRFFKSTGSSKTYSGSNENISYRFTDGTTNVVTNASTGNAVSWGSNHVTKTTKYTFADGTTNSVVTTVPGVVGSPSYAADVETKVTTYSDGTISTSTFRSTTNAKAYSGSSETVTFRFADGTTNVVTNIATSSVVSWGSNHTTKTTKYSFADGTINSVAIKVPGTSGLPTYAGGVETKVTTYGDGTTSIATFASTSTAKAYSGSSETVTYKFADGTSNVVTNAATSNVITWGNDHVSKTTKYTFTDNTTNTVNSTEQPTLSGLTFSAAIYPSDWTTSGIVRAPTTTPSIRQYGDGYSVTFEDGTSSKPFNQSTLTPNGPTGIGAINDPNAVVQTANASYNLAWGTPDKSGPANVAIFSKASTTLATDFNWFGVSLHGRNNSVGATMSRPGAEILAAWSQGWTGMGKNLLVLDDLNGLNAGTSAHAFVTSFIAGYYTAHGANTYLLDYNLTGNIYGATSSTVAASPAPTSIQVINASYEVLPSTSVATPHINFYNGTRIVSNLTVTDATIVMAAGNAASNSSASATSDNATRMAMVNDNSIGGRLILVGATNLSFLGYPQLASYSNYAGSNVNVQSRFLVASGTVPFGYSATIIGNNLPSSTVVGTSYAAPLVAGYATIVRQKFPNLSGANTADILLSTARYDTLSCYPSCDKALYGQGEASLSRALAPVGYLR